MQSAVILNSTAPAIAPAAVVSARDLVRRYGDGDTAVDALRGVSVDIAHGRLTAVMGPSGSGKSTLMHILAGLDKPTSGDVSVAGVDITGLDDAALTKLRRDHIGFIFQFFNLLPMLTAAENIALPLKLAGSKPDPAVARRAGRARSASATASSHRPSELSGGQQQRVAVARALVSRPERDVRRRADRQPRLAPPAARSSRLLRDSVDTLGQTTVMVTHDAHAAAIADRVLFLADGDIVRDLGPSTRARDPRDARAGERAMIAVALKGLAGRKVRALLTAFAIVIGVSMVSGTFILTDTMQKSFNGLFTASSTKTDAVISGKEIVKNSTTGSGVTIPDVAARQGPGAARGRGGRRPGLPAGVQRRRHHRPRRQEGRAGEPGRQHRPRQRAVQPARAQDRRLARGPGAGRDRRRHRRQGATTRSATPSSSRRSARSTPTGSPAPCRSAASTRSASRASRPGTSRPRRRCCTARAATTSSRSPRSRAPRCAELLRAVTAAAPRHAAGQGQRQAGQGRRGGARQLDGHDPHRSCSASAASRCSSARSSSSTRCRSRSPSARGSSPRCGRSAPRASRSCARSCSKGLVIGLLASVIGLLFGLGIAKGMVALFGALGVELPEGRDRGRRADDHRLAHARHRDHAAREHPAGEARHPRAADRRGPRGRDAAADAGSAAHSLKAGLGRDAGLDRRDPRSASSPAAAAGSRSLRSWAAACSGCSPASRCSRRGSSSRWRASSAGRRAASAASPASWPARTPSANPAGPRRPPPRS